MSSVGTSISKSSDTMNNSSTFLNNHKIIRKVISISNSNSNFNSNQDHHRSRYNFSENYTNNNSNNNNNNDEEPNSSTTISSFDHHFASRLTHHHHNKPKKTKNKDKAAAAATASGGSASSWIKGRISLDIQVKNILNLNNLRDNHHHHRHHRRQSSNNYTLEKQILTSKDQKKAVTNLNQRQPSSPGGRLARILNSLFSHSSLKKKKKKKSKCSVESMEDYDHDDEDENESSGNNGKRRISISHFVETPTKNYKEQLLSINSKLNNEKRELPAAVVRPKSSSCRVVDERDDDDDDDDDKTRRGKDGDDHDQYQLCGFLDEKLKLRNGVVEKQVNYLKKSEKDRILQMKISKLIDDDDDYDEGDETDSSSDLFELQIYDLDYYSKSNSTGLPVYESTDIDTIKRRNSISNLQQA